MEPRPARPSRFLGLMLTAFVAFATSGKLADAATTGLKKLDPVTVVPLEQVAAHARNAVAEVIRDAHFHKQGKPETFPCNPRIYMKLLSDPVLTLALWHDLGQTPARLTETAPGKYQGTDGAGTNANWEFVLRSPRLNVLLCDLQYASPRGAAKLDGRIVLIVRSGFFREVNGEFWIQQEVEAYVKIDSRGWKAVAVTIRPLIEKLLEDQVQEAGWFISLMGRLVETHPDWASGVVAQHVALPAENRKSFVEVVKQTKRPGASPGRPVLADSTATRTR